MVGVGGCACGGLRPGSRSPVLDSAQAQPWVGVAQQTGGRCVGAEVPRKVMGMGFFPYQQWCCRVEPQTHQRTWGLSCSGDRQLQMDQVKLLWLTSKVPPQVPRDLLKHLVSEFCLQGRAPSAHWVAVRAELFPWVHPYTLTRSLPPMSSLLIPTASRLQCCARLPSGDPAAQVPRLLSG